MNKGNLYIHIGPPKTATTSLQYYFQELEIDHVVYKGIFQPRKDNNSLADLIFRDVAAGKRNYLRRIEQEIAFLIKKYKYLIISEEQFLTSNWEKNIFNLFNYLEEFNPKIIITIRNPEDAIISFYQQIYTSLPVKYQKNIDLFLKSNYCQIYSYKYLINKLKEIGFKEIIILDYQKLINGEHKISDIFLDSVYSQDQRILLSKKNISRSNKNKRITKPLTIKMQVANIISRLPKPKFLRGSRLSEKLILLLPNYQIKKEKELLFDNFDTAIIDHYKAEYYYIKKLFNL